MQVGRFVGSWQLGSSVWHTQKAQRLGLCLVKRFLLIPLTYPFAARAKGAWNTGTIYSKKDPYKLAR